MTSTRTPTRTARERQRVEPEREPDAEPQPTDAAVRPDPRGSTTSQPLRRLTRS